MLGSKWMGKEFCWAQTFSRMTPCCSCGSLPLQRSSTLARMPPCSLLRLILDIHTKFLGGATGKYHQRGRGGCHVSTASVSYLSV